MRKPFHLERYEVCVLLFPPPSRLPLPPSRSASPLFPGPALTRREEQLVLFASPRPLPPCLPFVHAHAPSQAGTPLEPDHYRAFSLSPFAIRTFDLRETGGRRINFRFSPLFRSSMADSLNRDQLKTSLFNGVLTVSSLRPGREPTLLPPMRVVISFFLSRRHPGEVFPFFAEKDFVQRLFLRRRSPSQQEILRPGKKMIEPVPAKEISVFICVRDDSPPPSRDSESKFFFFGKDASCVSLPRRRSPHLIPSVAKETSMSPKSSPGRHDILAECLFGASDIPFFFPFSSSVRSLPD